MAITRAKDKASVEVNRGKRIVSGSGQSVRYPAFVPDVVKGSFRPLFFSSLRRGRGVEIQLAGHRDLMFWKERIDGRLSCRSNSRSPAILVVLGMILDAR